MTRRQQVIEELRDWATITGCPLPYPAETIADLEGCGFCVDLVDGSVSWAAPLLEARVQLTPTGKAAYAAWQRKARERDERIFREAQP